mmetsp:Transcript_27287/g.63563  ORF Transcript_27287/g.63563 Transcript_27287/m.63563 type:complete len:907 (-) Transcript_27287:119-2839(-)
MWGRDERRTSSTSEVDLPLLDSSSSASQPKPEQVIAWLRTNSEDSVLQVLSAVASVRPGLLQRAAAAEAGCQSGRLHRWLRGAMGSGWTKQHCSPQPELLVPQESAELRVCIQPPSQSPVSMLRRSRALEWQSRRGDLAFQSAEWGPVVQFSAVLYLCSMEEPHVTLSVIRLGNHSCASEVSYTTRDASAKAGRVYAKTSGKVVFSPGEGLQYIQVPLINSEKWTPTLDFAVELTEDGMVNASLGQFGWRAQVKVDNSKIFPMGGGQGGRLTRSKSHNTLAQRLEEVSNCALFFHYFKLNWQDPVVRTGTIKTVLRDQCHNLYWVLRLFMNVNLVDFVLKPSSPHTSYDNKVRSLVLVMAFMVCPVAFLHLLDYHSITWKVGGSSHMMLQSALLRRFLDYEEASRLDLRKGDLLMAMTRDTCKLVTEGYMNVLKLVAHFGKLLMLSAYQFVVPVVCGTPLSTAFVLPFVLFPVLLVSFLATRRRMTTGLLKAQNAAQNSLVEHIDNIVSNYRLIADYSRRAVFVEKFEVLVAAYNAATNEVQKVVTNDGYAATWLMTAMVAVYTLLGSMRVVHGILPLGLFLTNVHVYTQVGEAWGHIYEHLLQVQMVFPGLLRIVFLMNLPTDLPERMELSRHCGETTQVLKETMTKDASRGVRADRLPIVMENLHCSYTVRRHSGEVCRTVDVHLPGRLVIHQGQFVSVIGPRGAGKTTLLKAVGGAVLPVVDGTCGFLIPPHLRMLHVGSDPMFFHGTLYANLTFGVHEGDRDACAERVVAILRRLELPEQVIDLVHSEEQLAWGEVLPLTQRHLLCVARALIANPDILVMHKPTLAFDERTSVNVLGLLKEFVVKRGVEEQDEGEWHRRRPRTCVITSSKKHGVEIADQVFHVSSKGIQLLDKNDVTPEMLV